MQGKHIIQAKKVFGVSIFFFYIPHLQLNT